MEKPRNVFIVGPMGAGKTTVGKLLADELGLEFLDSDKEIEDRTGADIGWIFDVEGETGFRKREAAMIDELTARSGVLVATGGGAVLLEENRKRLVSRGTVISAPWSNKLSERAETAPARSSGMESLATCSQRYRKIGARSIRRSPTSPLRRIVAQRRPWLRKSRGRLNRKAADL